MSENRPVEDFLFFFSKWPEPTVRLVSDHYEENNRSSAPRTENRKLRVVWNSETEQS